MKTVVTLADYITSHLSTPFEWGKFDCILFASGWARHATGVDHLAGTPPWASANQAMRAVKALGGIEVILDARFDRIHPNMAKDGDLALYQEAAHLFSGVHIVGPGKRGLLFTDRMKADGAWSVTKHFQTRRV